MEILAGIDFATLRLYLSYIFLLFGVFDVLVGMIGLIRLPDIYNRLHATTKIATTGAFFVLLSILIQDGFTAFGLKAIAIGIFLLMTAPVAGHVIGRAAYNINIPPCDQTLFDAYGGKRQGDYCDGYDFHEGSYVYLDIERREKDHIQSDHFEERLTGQFSEEFSGLVQTVAESTPYDLMEDEEDEEELITGTESVEKAAPVFEPFEHSQNESLSTSESDSAFEEAVSEPEEDNSSEVEKRPELAENMSPEDIEKHASEKKDD